MVKPTNKQRLDKQKKEFVTVAQLMEFLKTCPSSTPIGTIGHFGEFLPLFSKASVSLQKAYITPNGLWRHGEKEFIQIINLEVPDKGPDPD